MAVAMKGDQPRGKARSTRARAAWLGNDVIDRTRERTATLYQLLLAIIPALTYLLGGMLLINGGEDVTIGTLVAFALVNVSVIVLRRSQPDLERSYRVPLFPVVPILGTLSCVLLAVFLGATTWIAFGIWMVAGAVLYLAYGRRHSTLR